MQKNNWIFGLVVFLIIIALSAWGFSKNKKIGADVLTQPTPSATVDGGEAVPTADNLIKDNEPYFDANASVMEFYQPSCGWCIKESAVLTELAAQGYRVKPMNAAADPSLWTKYNVSGTPTFVAANGDRKEGYLALEEMKAFLDAHK